VSSYPDNQVLGPEWRESNTSRPYPLSTRVDILTPSGGTVDLSDFFNDATVYADVPDDEGLRLALVEWDTSQSFEDGSRFILETSSGETVVDSVEATDISVYAYDDDKWWLYEARGASWCLKLVLWQEIADSIFDPVLPGDTVTYELLSGAFLEERCITRPQAVLESITVGEDTLTGSVSFDNGYNALMDIDYGSTGAERRISLHGIPGEGLGKFALSEPREVYLSTLMSVLPDEHGHLYLDGDPCYFFHPEFEEDLSWPYPDYQLTSTCTACCDCLEYVKLYEMLRSITNRASSMAVDIDYAKSRYYTGSSMFESEKTTRAVVYSITYVKPRNGLFLEVKTYVVNDTEDTVTLSADSTWTFTTSGGLEIAIPSSYPMLYEGGEWTNINSRTTVLTDSFSVSGTVDIEPANIIVFSSRAYFKEAEGAEEVTVEFDGEADSFILSDSDTVALEPYFSPE